MPTEVTSFKFKTRYEECSNEVTNKERTEANFIVKKLKYLKTVFLQIIS